MIFKRYILASNCITVELSNKEKQEFRVASSKVSGVVLTGEYIETIEIEALEAAQKEIEKLKQVVSIQGEALEDISNHWEVNESQDMANFALKKVDEILNNNKGEGK